jgi:propionate CoA-transferase
MCFSQQFVASSYHISESSWKKGTPVPKLAIGLPEGVASVAAEEEILDYITLSTEPGVSGGLQASGQNIYNATSLLEMKHMPHFYDGDGCWMNIRTQVKRTQMDNLDV